MINAAIVMSPMDTTPVAGAGTAGKSQPDGPAFGAVLDSKIKDEQTQTQDANNVEAKRPEEQPKSKAETKPSDKSDDQTRTSKEAKPLDKPQEQAKAEHEVKSPDKPEVQAKSDPETVPSDTPQEPTKAEDEAKAKPSDTKLGDEAVAQMVSQEVVSQAAAAAKPANDQPVPPSQTAPAVEPAASATSDKSQKQTVKATDISGQSVAVPIEQVAETTESVIPTSAANSADTQSATTQQAVTQSAASGTTDSGAQVAPKKNTFFGFAARNTAQETPQNGATDAAKSAEVEPQPKPQDKTASESPKNLFAVKADPQAAQPQPVQAQPQDMTTKPQVMAAIKDEMSTQTIKVSVSDGAAKTGSDSAQSGQSQPSAQDAAFMIPGRTSFESVIRGLDTAPTPRSTDTPSTETHTRIMDQVVQEIKLLQFQGQTDMTIKLNPAELGALRLRVSQTVDGMTTQIHASSDQVKGLLQSNISALSQALSDVGVKMDQVTVTSGTSYGSLMHDNASGTAYQQRHKSRSNNSGGSPEAGVNPAAINAAMGGVVSGGSVGYSWLA